MFFSEVVIKSAGNELSFASSAYFMQNATSFRFSIWHELQNVNISNIAVCENQQYSSISSLN